jgi:hypothetical protein
MIGLASGCLFILSIAVIKVFEPDKVAAFGSLLSGFAIPLGIFTFIHQRKKEVSEENIRQEAREQEQKSRMQSIKELSLRQQETKVANTIDKCYNIINNFYFNNNELRDFCTIMVPFVFSTFVDDLPLGQ